MSWLRDGGGRAAGRIGRGGDAHGQFGYGTNSGELT